MTPPLQKERHRMALGIWNEMFDGACAEETGENHSFFSAEKRRGLFCSGGAG